MTNQSPSFSLGLFKIYISIKTPLLKTRFGYMMKPPKLIVLRIFEGLFKNY